MFDIWKFARFNAASNDFYLPRGVVRNTERCHCLLIIPSNFNILFSWLQVILLWVKVLIKVFLRLSTYRCYNRLTHLRYKYLVVFTHYLIYTILILILTSLITVINCFILNTGFWIFHLTVSPILFSFVFLSFFWLLCGVVKLGSLHPALVCVEQILKAFFCWVEVHRLVHSYGSFVVSWGWFDI